MVVSDSDSDTNHDDIHSIRRLLKIVRDSTKTAYDQLPNGKTIGAFAHDHAVSRYSSRLDSKRIQARQNRRRKHDQTDGSKGVKKRKTDVPQSEK